MRPLGQPPLSAAAATLVPERPAARDRILLRAIRRTGQKAAPACHRIRFDSGARRQQLLLIVRLLRHPWPTNKSGVIVGPRATTSAASAVARSISRGASDRSTVLQTGLQTGRVRPATRTSDGNQRPHSGARNPRVPGRTARRRRAILGSGLLASGQPAPVGRISGPVLAWSAGSTNKRPKARSRAWRLPRSTSALPHELIEHACGPPERTSSARTRRDSRRGERSYTRRGEETMSLTRSRMLALSFAIGFLASGWGMCNDEK